MVSLWVLNFEIVLSAAVSLIYHSVMKKNFSFVLIVFVSSVFCISSFAQISFTNQAFRLTDPTHYSGVAVTINDVNNDGLDDIVILDDARELKIEFQGLNGVWTAQNTGQQMDNGNAWGMAAGDATNNGHSDIFSGLFGGQPDYAKANVSGTDYTIADLPDYGLATQCVNLADMDADGDIDFFSCGDTGPSGIWKNDGTGVFSYSGDSIIPMTPTAGTPWGSWDGSGNYGSTFTDYDLDGDIDLYISHCRQSGSDPADPRLINQMFVNDGNGNYAEDFTNDNQLRIGAQSWTTDFQDFDNDGDFDAYVTNHNVNDMLLENVDGVFTDIYAASGLTDVVSTPIQGLMRDFDNDMYVDILITGNGSPSYAYYKNNGDKTFTLVPGAFGNQRLYSMAVGDLNHDGFQDVYGSSANLYTNPSNTPDAVWINNANDNNWLAVNLEGTISNRSAIGAVVRMYGPWGVQVREVRSGESYGICNSLMAYFGLAQNTEIDSVVVDWPSSGIHQVVETPSPNQFLTIIENVCVAPEAFITSTGPTVLCAGQSLDLQATTGTSYSYEWSTGAQTSQISITTTGTYMVRITDTGSGCSSVSASVDVQVSPDETPEVSIAGDLKFCQGESIMLTSSAALAYQWSNGLGSDQNAEVTESGSYSVTTTGACADFTSTVIDVEVLAAPAPVANDVTLLVPGAANLSASGVGADFYWYEQAVGGTVAATGASYTTPVVNSNTSFWVEEEHAYSADVASGGKMDTTQVNGSYHNSTGFYLIFDVFENSTLNSVKVYTDEEADRIVYIEDENEVLIYSQEFTVPAGESRINFTNWNLSPGTNYRIRVQEPDHGFWRDNSELQVNFPYNMGDLMSITGANTGNPNYYYYFYDWEVEGEGFMCVSDRTEVVVTIGTVGIEEGELSGVEVYPNPASDFVTVAIPASVEGLVEMNVLDALGHLVYSKTANSGVNQLDVSALSSGIYFLEMRTKSGRHLRKLTVR
ncbi:MAG: hypothetical protein ACI9Z7_000583 [Alteromonas macleodii]|jgi:hypothetical protein